MPKDDRDPANSKTIQAGIQRLLFQKGGVVMKKLFSMFFGLIWKVLKGAACLAVLMAVFAVLSVNQNAGDNRSPYGTEENLNYKELYETEKAKSEWLEEQLNTTYQVTYSFVARVLPGLELDWLEFPCGSSTGTTGREEYDSMSVGDERVIGSWGVIDWCIVVDSKSST